MGRRDRFLQEASGILETACNGGSTPDRARLSPSWTILIHGDGRIHLSSDSDWPLDTLAAEQGASAAYRVTSAEGRVRVEGRQGARTCVLEAETTTGAAQRALAGPALYYVRV